MTRPPNTFIITAGIILIAVILHLITSKQTITYLPAPLILAIIFTWIKNQPWRYLLALAIISELFSLAPIGLSTITIFLPLLIYRLRGRFVDVDLSFSFLILILSSAISQIILQLSPFVVLSLATNQSLVSILSQLPFRPLSLTIGSITIAAFVTILVTNNLTPSDNIVVPIDRQPISIIH